VKRVKRYDWDGTQWIDQSTGKKDRSSRYLADRGQTLADITPDPSIYGKALAQLKLVFERNAKGTKLRNLKAGKVNASVLGKRAAVGDHRMFYVKSLPRERDYVVMLHMDVSGSTRGNIANQKGDGTFEYEQILTFEKKAIYAQAELLSRLGVKFMIVGASGNGESNKDEYYLFNCVFNIKSADQPWDNAAKERLLKCPAMGGNLDGHAALIALWELMKFKAEKKILMYYTDGEMPASNYDDELLNITRSIATAKQNDIAMMGVGVRTNSPQAHGLDTVQIDSAGDLSTVVAHLGRVLGMV
jgi:nitric oxide reductase activation protein